jgi:hypothetical protein
MRTVLARLMLVVAAVATAVALQVAPAGGHAPVDVDVTKEIVGTPPPGTTFTVVLTCVLAPEFPPEVETATFTEAGTQTVTVANGAECEVTEPENGGASSVTIEPNPVEVSDGGAVTVTNTFVPEPPPTAASAATPEPVAAAPAFTG